MKHIAIAALAALALSATQARAESNYLAQTETPQAAAATQSSATKIDVGSEQIPVFSEIEQQTENGPATHDVTSEQDPVFDNEMPAPAIARTVANSAKPRG